MHEVGPQLFPGPFVLEKQVPPSRPSPNPPVLAFPSVFLSGVDVCLYPTLWGIDFCCICLPSPLSHGCPRLSCFSPRRQSVQELMEGHRGDPGLEGVWGTCSTPRLRSSLCRLLASGLHLRFGELSNYKSRSQARCWYLWEP